VARLRHGCASLPIDVGQDALVVLGCALAGKDQPAERVDKEKSGRSLLKPVDLLVERVGMAPLGY